MIEQFVKQVTKEFELEDSISQPEPNHYIFSLEDMEVNLTSFSQGHTFKSTIANCPKDNTDAFLLKTMEANLFGVGTHDAVIGLNEEGTQLVLSMDIDSACSYGDFKNKFEDFVNVADFWKNEALKHH